MASHKGKWRSKTISEDGVTYFPKKTYYLQPYTTIEIVCQQFNSYVNLSLNVADIDVMGHTMVFLDRIKSFPLVNIK